MRTAEGRGEAEGKDPRRREAFERVCAGSRRGRTAAGSGQQTRLRRPFCFVKSPAEDVWNQSLAPRRVAVASSPPNAAARHCPATRIELYQIRMAACSQLVRHFDFCPGCLCCASGCPCTAQWSHWFQPTSAVFWVRSRSAKPRVKMACDGLDSLGTVGKTRRQMSISYISVYV